MQDYDGEKEKSRESGAAAFCSWECLHHFIPLHVGSLPLGPGWWVLHSPSIPPILSPLLEISSVFHEETSQPLMQMKMVEGCGMHAACMPRM